MNSVMTVLAGLALPLLVLACTGESKVMKPATNQNSAVEALQATKAEPYLLCNKDEEALSFPDEAQKDLFVVEEAIPIQEFVYYRCDGTIQKGKSGTHRFSKKVAIPTTLELRRTRKLVGFVEVRNHRSCDVTRIGVSTRELALPGFENYFSYLSKTGTLKLVLNNDGYRGYGATEQLGIQEGKNLVEIKYFGKCLKYKENKNNKLDEPKDCIEAEKVATRWITLDVQIDRPEIAGVQVIHEKQCDVNKKLDEIMKKYKSE